MKKILLLGGSAQQLVAIKAAKELGYYTIVCDYLPDNPGQYEADKFYATSTTDIEAVYEIAKEEQINGILAYASDPAALPAAIVAEKLGLPTNPAKSVEILGLKYPWRKFLHDNGFACPKFYPFNPQTPIDEIKNNIKNFTFPFPSRMRSRYFFFNEEQIMIPTSLFRSRLNAASRIRSNQGARSSSFNGCPSPILMIFALG